MATHSSALAWRIPGTAGPGGLPSMGSQSRTRLKRLSSSSGQSSDLIPLQMGTRNCATSFLKVTYFSDLATDSENNIGLARTGFSVRCCGK